ncbi:MAG TPA: MarP family serine protease [Candidatus Saccharimonadales bacterium]|nr:MarP family serine protease [Candidatus Saccharimonadales bacterium]
MNTLDLVAIGLVVVAIVLGFRSGAFPQLGGLLGAIGGGAIVVLALPAMTDPLGELDPVVRPFVVLAALIAAVALGEAVGSHIGRSIARSLGTGVLGAADRVFGAFVGAAQALLIIWLVGGLAAIGPVPRISEAAQTSTAIRSLNALLPPATEIAAELGDVIGTSGLPEVFLGFEPLPRPPITRPSDAEARRVGALAEGATVRVEALTCGLESTGSGAIIADGYVVTNAHVVAGSQGATQVVMADGDRADATVVLFDPSLDVAVLHARSLDGDVLRFAASDPSRGATGASLGYPGGGGLTIVPVAVTGRYPARGRDIYGEDTITRDILELRAEIDRGDSGGPFVLADGTIGGLIFAEARTDPEVGYALAPTAVAARVMPAIGRSGDVDTGDCVH